MVAPNGDFDLYTFEDNCQTQLPCQGEATGDEDFTCTVSSGTIPIRILIYAYDGSGSYQFAISQVSAPNVTGSMVIQ